MVNPIASVTLFAGSEIYLKQSALSKLKKSLAEGTGFELDLKIFYGQDSGAREILDHAQTLPFFSAKRLIVIKEFEKLSKEDKASIVDYAKKPSKHTYLVIDTKDAEAAKYFRPALESVRVMVFNELTGADTSLWIKRYLAPLTVKMDQEAIDIIKELVGSNLLSLANELDKLVTYVGQRKVIGAQDVERLVGKSHIASAFDLGWHIGKKDVGGALNLVSELLLYGKRAHEIIGLLSWHFNRIAKANKLLAHGERPNAVADIMNIGGKYQEQFFAQAGSFGMERIKSKMRVLLDADIDIKRTRFDPGLVLELTIIRLCLT